MKIQNVHYVARDMNRTCGFYEALGLSLQFRDGDRWAQFTTDGGKFALASVEEAAAGTQGGVVVFEVDSLDEGRARIEAAGGVVGTSRDMGSHGRTLSFTDPDGNACQFFERAKG